MILEHFVVGMLQTNCYLLGDPKTHEGVVIDPGGDSDRIIRGIKEHNLKLVAILLIYGFLVRGNTERAETILPLLMMTPPSWRGDSG